MATAAIQQDASSDFTAFDMPVCGPNVELGFAGPGRMEARSFTTNDWVLSGGTFASVSNVVPSTIPGCVLHLDATDLTTIDTNSSGKVLAWRSKVGNTVFTNRLNYTYNNVTYYDLQSPYYDPTYAGNRGGVAFGFEPDGTTAIPTHLCAIGRLMQTGSVFVVFMHHTSWQNWPIVYGIGNNSGFGFYSSAVSGHVQFFRNTSYFTQMRQNGVLAYDEATELGYYRNINPAYKNNPNPIADVEMGRTYVVHADLLRTIDGPHLGMSRFDSLANSSPYYFKGWIGEVVAYDRNLSTNERSIVEMQLMRKWGVAPGAELAFQDTLGTNSTLTVAGDATLELPVVQHFGTIAFAKDANGVAPTLTVRGQMDLAKTELALTGAAKTKSATLIENPDRGISGEFKNAATIDLGKLKLRHTDSRVRISGEGLIILFR